MNLELQNHLIWMAPAILGAGLANWRLMRRDKQELRLFQSAFDKTDDLDVLNIYAQMRCGRRYTFRLPSSTTAQRLGEVGRPPPRE